MEDQEKAYSLKLSLIYFFFKRHNKNLRMLQNHDLLDDIYLYLIFPLNRTYLYKFKTLNELSVSLTFDFVCP